MSTVITSDEEFASIAARGGIKRASTGKYIGIVSQRPGRLLMTDATIIKSSTMAEAEREFEK